ncbi:MAG: aldehyde dehydrogenase [Deltaproteobacteria bacterium]|nr:MAG: aldehyde dehydrogenase [Deltaproteobacteria bacterium]
MDTAKLDRALDVLDQNKERWLDLSVGGKIALVKKMIQGIAKVSNRMVAKAHEMKKISPDSPSAAEDMLSGPVVIVRNLRLLLETLEQIEKHKVPQLPQDKIRTRNNGQVVVEVLPSRFMDNLLYNGFKAEVWMQEGVTPNNLTEHMAEIYQKRPESGKIALVLGAGNVSSIGPLDVVYKLFVEGQVCILKLNPVNEYTGPFVEEAFRCLVDEGFLQMAYGGADVGSYLCQHDKVDEIHITGSDKTHDVIVYGPGEEGAERKRNNDPKLTKRITSELGNVSPVIVVPGPWKTGDLQFHAENIATQMTNNAGFNCNASKVLITHDGWDQRESLLAALRQTLRDLPPRNAYYPGATDRYSSFMGASEKGEALGSKSGPGDVVPWTLVPGLDPNDEENKFFNEESFCAITGETALAAQDAGDFLEKAVNFCNETLHGTLNACIIVHPETAEQLGAKLEQAIADLKYGSVAINHWPALSYAMGVTTWGAYPGHTLEDIQSGIGVVHNTWMFEKPEKSVVYGPFNVWPRPPWFVTHQRAHKVANWLFEVERTGSYVYLPPLVLNAARG